MNETKVWIPEISNEKLTYLMERIQPVFEFESGLRYIHPVNPRNESYIWVAEPAEPATGLERICDIVTYHGFGYHGFFKPSIAEVLAQIPEELVDSGKVIAFQIVKHPEDADDLNREKEALNAGYHVAITRLYRQAT